MFAQETRNFGYQRRLRSPLAGTVIVGASVTNMAFVFPFILSLLGPDALAQAMLYDIGNSIFVAAFAYAIAIKYGRSAQSTVLASFIRVLRSPLLMAIGTAVIVSICGYQTPRLLEAMLRPLATSTVPLILIALGMSISAAKRHDAVVYSTVAIRMLGGLVGGLLCTFAFGLPAALAVVVLIAASAPIGFNLATFASIARLDMSHATAALSVSIVVGLLTVTATVLLGAHWLAAGN